MALAAVSEFLNTVHQPLHKLHIYANEAVKTQEDGVQISSLPIWSIESNHHKKRSIVFTSRHQLLEKIAYIIFLKKKERRNEEKEKKKQSQCSLFLKVAQFAMYLIQM